LNYTSFSDGTGSSLSIVLAADKNGLYLVVNHQELEGQGYFIALGGEGAIGDGNVLPSNSKYYTRYTSRNDKGILGGLNAPLKSVKGIWGFSGGVTFDESGNSSVFKGRRGLALGGFTGTLKSTETWKFKLCPG